MLAILALIPGVGPALAFIRANPWVLKVLAVVSVVVVLLGLILGLIGHGRTIQRREDAAAYAKALQDAETKNAAALAAAEAQKIKDDAETAALEKELTSAYAKTPDSKPSAARLALACQRLRNQSGSGSAVAVACRS